MFTVQLREEAVQLKEGEEVGRSEEEEAKEVKKTRQLAVSATQSLLRHLEGQCMSAIMGQDAYLYVSHSQNDNGIMA